MNAAAAPAAFSVGSGGAFGATKLIRTPPGVETGDLENKRYQRGSGLAASTFPRRHSKHLCIFNAMGTARPPGRRRGPLNAGSHALNHGKRTVFTAAADTKPG